MEMAAESNDGKANSGRIDGRYGSGNEPLQFDNSDYQLLPEELDFSETSWMSECNFSSACFEGLADYYNTGVVPPNVGFPVSPISDLFSQPLAVTSLTQTGELLTPEYLEGTAYSPPGSTAGCLPAPKSTWTIEQEKYLLEAKKSGCSFKAISAAMNQRFGIERNTNVLSKKYRAIRDRSVPESVLDQALRNTLPDMLQVLEEEMRRIDPDGVDKQHYSEIRQELLRKLPGFVHRLDLS